MELKGNIKLIGETQAISDKFKKRDIVITEYHPEYPQHILFQVTQDKCDLLDKFKEGQEITAHFNLRGREWISPQGEVKHFNTLEIWRIETEAGSTQKLEDIKHETDYSEKDDDLPF